MGYPTLSGPPATTRRVRIRARRGSQLGILPLVAAAVPSVSTILGNIGKSVLSIFDPGKKRDANREARAEMFYQFASAGSLTAARALYGGAERGSVGAASEIAMYKTRWAKLQAANPTLAAQAVQAGPVGVGPDPGLNPPTIPSDEQQAIQAEINVYHAAHAAAGTTPPAQPGLTISTAGVGTLVTSPVVLGAALVAAILLNQQKRR